MGFSEKFACGKGGDAGASHSGLMVEKVPVKLYEKNPTIADIIFWSVWNALAALMFATFVSAEVSPPASILTRWGFKIAISSLPAFFILAGMRIVFTHALDFDNGRITYIRRMAFFRIWKKNIPLDEIASVEICMTNVHVFGSNGGLRYNLLMKCKDSRRNLLVRCEERKLEMIEAVRPKIAELLSCQQTPS